MSSSLGHPRVYLRRIGLVFTASVLAVSCAKLPTEHPVGPLRIVIVGEGIPQTGSPPPQQHPINRAEALAMFSGFMFRWNALVQNTPISRCVVVEGMNDGGRSEPGRTASLRLRDDPHVLAVVGHGSSAVTREALPAYATARIPLLMPIATGAGVKSPYSFRLPLNDQEGQGPAVAKLVEDLDLDRVLILTDISVDATVYAQPLAEEIHRLLSQRRFGGLETIDTSANEAAIKARDVVQSVIDNRVDGVIFVGYASSAVRLMGALNSAFTAAADAEPPVLILTDGCIAPDLRVGAFTAYLTAPLPDPRFVSSDCPDERTRDFRRHFAGRAQINYEVLGWDAASILHLAITECLRLKDVSRACLAHQLANQRFEGLCRGYRFIDSENIDGLYSVYRLTDTTNGLQMTLRNTYHADELHAYKENRLK